SPRDTVQSFGAGDEWRDPEPLDPRGVLVQLRDLLGHGHRSDDVASPFQAALVVRVDLGSRVGPEGCGLHGTFWCSGRARTSMSGNCLRALPEGRYARPYRSASMIDKSHRHRAKLLGS